MMLESVRSQQEVLSIEFDTMDSDDMSLRSMGSNAAITVGGNSKFDS